MRGMSHLGGWEGQAHFGKFGLQLVKNGGAEAGGGVAHNAGHLSAA